MELSKLNLQSNTISVLKEGDEIWFPGKSNVRALGYANTTKPTRNHINIEDKAIFGQFKGKNNLFLSRNLHEKMVFHEVLPSIRKTGSYQLSRTVKNQIMLVLETDLHYKIVGYIKRFHPNALIKAGLGEHQDKEGKRIDAYRKGYWSGEPDLKILNLHKRYNDSYTEPKTPNGTTRVSDNQEKLLKRYEENGFKVPTSNDYNALRREVDEYCKDGRITCGYSLSPFKRKQSRSNHIKHFHRTDF